MDIPHRFNYLTIILLFFLIFIPVISWCQAIGTLATASSSGGGTGGYGPVVINNGVNELMDPMEYHWVMAGPVSWVELTWSSQQDVRYIYVDTNDTHTFAPNAVQYWDGGSYVTVADRGRETNDWAYLFGSVLTTRLRFYDIEDRGVDPRIFEIEVYANPTPVPTYTPTSTPTGTWYSRTPTFTATPFPSRTPTFTASPRPTSTSTLTVTPTPTGTWFSPTPVPNCIDELRYFEPWSSCENIRGPIPGTKSSVWEFDDCDYCRVPGNPCFEVPCTFAMYVVAECGRDFHIPLWDNETGHIQIKSCEKNEYVFLEGSSTGGWSASGTNVSWEDCGGTNSYWNNQVTDIFFSDPVALCGIYRIEFIDWGGFIWDLYANCTGTDDPGFLIYDNMNEAQAAYKPKPELDIDNIRVTGKCPNFTVSADVSNLGCGTVDVPVCVETSLGGRWDFIVPAVHPGETKAGYVMIMAPSCTVPYSITATVDCDNVVDECTEVTSNGCNPPGTGSGTVYFMFTVPTTPTATPSHPINDVTFKPFMILALLLGSIICLGRGRFYALRLKK